MKKPFAIPARPTAVNVRELVTTPRGVALWLVEDYAVPLVSLEFAFRGGAAQDPAGKAGRGTMLAGLLDEGAGESRLAGFHQALDEKAIEISFHSERDHSAGGCARWPASRPRRRAAAACVNAPRFDEAPFERVREQMNAQFRHEANDPGSMASRAWRAHALSPAIPMACRRTASWKACRDRARRTYSTPPSADITRGATEDRRRRRDRRGARGGADRRGLRRSAGRRARSSPSPTRLRRPRRVEIVDLDVPQSTIRFGRPALRRDDPDYIASVVPPMCCGGSGSSSRLFREVREKRGLAYSVFGVLLRARSRAAISMAARRPRTSAPTNRSTCLSRNPRPGARRPHRGGTREGQEISDRLLSAALRHFGQDRRPARPHPARRPRRRAGSSSATAQIAAVTMADARRAAERAFGDGSLLSVRWSDGRRGF